MSITHRVCDEVTRLRDWEQRDYTIAWDNPGRKCRLFLDGARVSPDLTNREMMAFIAHKISAPQREG